MGVGRRTRVSNEGSIPQSSALLGLLNFVMEPYEPPVPSQSVHKEDSNHSVLLTEEAQTAPHPTSPVLEGTIPMETNEVASMPELNIGTSSLNHVFPFNPLSSLTAHSKNDGKLLVPTLSQPPPMPLRRWYLHRTPTGKLTAIGPSPLCQEATKSLLEEEDDKGENRLVYAGYRIWNRDPRKWGESCSEEMEADTGFEASPERLESDTGFNVELTPDAPSNFSFPSGDDTSDCTCSESSTESLSMRRTFPIASQNLGPFQSGSEPTNFEEDDKQSLTSRPSSQGTKQTTGQGVTYTLPIRSRPFYNPSLKHEIKFNNETASRPIPTDCRDLARIQFKNRRGPLWNLANKDLQELYLHAMILHESEFLDLIFCEKGEVQTWLHKYSFRLTYRSQKQWYKAIDTLRSAGIPPSDINKEVLDIFEWMTEQEQADFMKGYQKLYALVKSSQEGLHLTPSEMEHFSRLSLADQYDFINEYKNRREEREKIVRRDTEIFTAKLRRTLRKPDETPYPDWSNPRSLQPLYGLDRAPAAFRRTATRKIPRKTESVDNFHIKFLQFGTGQEKVGKLESLSKTTHLPSPLFASPVMTRIESKFYPVGDQQTRRRSTTFTGDGRVRYCRFYKPTLMQPSCRDDSWKRDEVEKTGETPTSSLFVQRGSDLSSEERSMIRELLASDDEGATEPSKDTVQIKTYTEGLKQDIKQELTNHFEDKVLNNCIQDCGRFATSRLSEVLKCGENHKEVVDSEVETEVGSLYSQLVLERSPRKEWLGEHPGTEVPLPTPPPTEHSAEGVIPPVTIEHLTVNDSPLTNLCIEHALSVTPASPTHPGMKSEPCTPFAEGYRDVFTKDHKTCTLHVDGPSKRSISYVTPPRRSYRSVRGSPSACVPENDLKDNLSEKSPRSLRQKVGTLLSSLRSKRTRGALKDVKYF